MDDVLIEVVDLKKIDSKLANQLKRASFRNTGWMQPCVTQIRKGVAPGGKKLHYPEAHAIVARNPQGDLLGWAMVRHGPHRRDDYMTWISPRHRRKGVARKLLVVAFHNFGKVQTYPHDVKSRAFYEKNKRFVSKTNDSWRMSLYQFYARDIY